MGCRSPKVGLSVHSLSLEPASESIEGGGNQSRCGVSQPNKGLQATAASVRSCLAPAARRA